MKKLLSVVLALTLAAALSLPASAAKEKDDGIRWLDLELPRDLAELIQEDRREKYTSFSFSYIESMDLLSVNSYSHYEKSWVFDLSSGEQTDYFRVYPLSEDLIVFAEDDGFQGYGLMDSRGKVLLDPVCMMPDFLGGGMVGMISDSEGEAYLLNAEGEVVETYDFDHTFNFRRLDTDKQGTGKDWLCLVTRDADTGLINADGELVIPFGRYQSVNGPVDGLVAVQDGDGLWGLVDGEGGEVLPCAYAGLWVGSDGLITVRNEEGKYGVLDTEGDEVLPFEYDYIDPFDGGLAKIYTRDGDDTLYGVIDDEGHVVVPCEYGYITVNLDMGVFLVKDGESMGVLDLEGGELLPMKYDRIYVMGEDRFSVQSGGRCGIVGRDGEYVFGPVRGQAAYPQGDAVVVLSDADFGVVSGIFTLEGEELVSADDYDGLNTGLPGSCVLYAVLDGEERKMGLISREGKELLPAQYDIVALLDQVGSEETYVVVDGRRVGFLDAPKPASQDRDKESPDGFPWLWAAIGGGAALVVVAVAVTVAAVSRKKKRAKAAAPVQPAAPVETPNFCPACGTKLASGSKFCPVCGHKL